MKTFLIAIFAAAWSLGSVAHAEKQTIDAIVAVVEDEVIFQSDIEQTVRQHMLQNQRSELSETELSQLRAKILTDLINDKLVIAESARRNIDIPFSEVEEKVNEALEQNMELLGGREAFERQLANEGFTINNLKVLYRKQIKNRMLVEQVLAGELERLAAGVSVDELQAFYEEKQSELPSRPAVVHLLTVFVAFEPSDDARNAAKAKLLALRNEIQGGADFGELAKLNSEDPTSKFGGELGFVKPSDLRDEVFSNTVASIGVGEISEPVLTSYGYHLVQVTEEKPGTEERKVRHILIRVEPTEADLEVAFQEATAVHDALVAGEPFDQLAREHSDDPTAETGGDLGWLKIDDLPQFFQDVLSSLSVGQLSQVLRESSGFRIVKLLEKETERTYEFSEVEKELRQMYRQEKMGEQYNKYVAKLRKKFTVVMH